MIKFGVKPLYFPHGPVDHDLQGQRTATFDEVLQQCCMARL